MAEKTASKKIETITIPLAEYVYLTKVEALMDVIINDESGYTNSPATRAAIKAAKRMQGICTDEAVTAE